MATRWGYATLCWLTERGWQEAPVPEEFICVDQQVIDPATGEQLTVYQAVSLHQERTGEFPAFLAELA